MTPPMTTLTMRVRAAGRGTQASNVMLEEKLEIKIKVDVVLLERHAVMRMGLEVVLQL
tara:strand:+ start:1492 stop:1665 length:174 start_codon:yes stop_codon:yes gene_type:complete